MYMYAGDILDVLESTLHRHIPFFTQASGIGWNLASRETLFRQFCFLCLYYRQGRTRDVGVQTDTHIMFKSTGTQTEAATSLPDTLDIPRRDSVRPSTPEQTAVQQYSTHR